MAILTGPVWGSASGGKPKQLVVLCHGVGADGNDLIGLAPLFAKTLPDALFVAPDGPEPCDMAPMGRQWFSIGDLDPKRLGNGVRHAGTVLGAFIDAELARLQLEQYALIGFSQGAMTVLFTGLRRSHGPKAILAYSGALIDPQSLGLEIQCKPPVLLAHGLADGVVPAFRSRDAETAVTAAGVNVTTVFEPGLAHGIGEAGLSAGVEMLEKAFYQ